MKKHTSSLILAAVASFVASLCLILTPFYLGRAIDFMVGVNTVNFMGVSYNLSLALFMYILSFVFTSISSLVSNRVSVSVVKDIRNDVHTHLNEVSLGYLDSSSKGSLGNVFASDGEYILDGLYQFLTQFLGGVFVVVIALGFMLSISVLMSLIVIGLVPLVFLTSSWVSKHSMRLFRSQQVIAGNLRESVSSLVDNHELVLSYSYHDDLRKEFVALNDDLVEVGGRAQFISAITNPTTRVVNNISYLLMGLSGAFVVQKYGLSVGFLMSFISYSMLFSKPFNEVSAVLAQVSAGRASYDRIQAILNVPKEPNNKNKVVLEGSHLKFENVNFSYTKGVELIQDLNLDIAPLSKVAIVGPTGSGKSTLINLLMRFVDADSGVISIDGINVDSISRSSVRGIMGIVLQDPWLFDGTVFDNIAYGKVDASEEDVYEAARLAGCYDFIVSLDHGFETHVSSSNISLGHRQMITIARCLVAENPILILDEATSSIDSLSEKHIQSVFSDIMVSHTSFFVAHRLSSVTDSDLILVMRDGRLVEKGSHTELMALNGFYSELFMSQF